MVWGDDEKGKILVCWCFSFFSFSLPLCGFLPSSSHSTTTINIHPTIHVDKWKATSTAQNQQGFSSSFSLTLYSFYLLLIFSKTCFTYVLWAQVSRKCCLRCWLRNYLKKRSRWKLGCGLGFLKMEMYYCLNYFKLTKVIEMRNWI